LLECIGLMFVTEGHIGLQPPRPILQGVRDLAGVVLLQPCPEVVGDADVEVLGIETFEKINLFHRMDPIESTTAQTRKRKRDESIQATGSMKSDG